MGRLLIFNPDCEMAVANGGRFYTPSANVAKMSEDLAFLPAWYAGEGDCVLVKEMPSAVFEEGVVRPFRLKGKAVTEDALDGTEALRGEPWGRSPKVCHWLKRRNMGEEWRPEYREWYSRSTARRGLAYLLERLAFLETGILPCVCRSLEEVERQVVSGRFVAKAPWSSSGRGVLFLEHGLGKKEREWLGGILHRQGCLMLERRLDKIQDFATEWHAGEGGVEFVGWSLFSTDAAGGYRGNTVASGERMECRLSGLIGREVLSALREIMPAMLRELLPGYRGYLGVDMMVYRNGEGKTCVQPCVEINLRNNMGIVALFLYRRYVVPGKEGELRVRFYPDAGEALSNHRQWQKEFPLICKNNRIESGYLSLAPVSETTRFMASLRCY